MENPKYLQWAISDDESDRGLPGAAPPHIPAKNDTRDQENTQSVVERHQR